MILPGLARARDGGARSPIFPERLAQRPRAVTGSTQGGRDDGDKVWAGQGSERASSCLVRARDVDVDGKSVSKTRCVCTGLSAGARRARRWERRPFRLAAVDAPQGPGLVPEDRRAVDAIGPSRADGWG